MARHLRRLIIGVLAALLALLLLALAALWWFLDPERLRLRLEREASQAIGRPVRIEPPLQWKAGWRIAITSAGGEVANAAGFSGAPLARWSRIDLGLALRPLLRREVRIDRIEIEGLALDLQRDAEGMVNWQFDLPQSASGGEAGVSVFHVEHMSLRDAALRYRDDAAATQWRIGELTLDVDLPEFADASEWTLRGVEVAAMLDGGPLPAPVPVRFVAPQLQVAAAQVGLPRFSMQWGAAQLEGSVQLSAGESPAAQGELSAEVPSVRDLLASLGVEPPAMRDPATLGALAVRARLHHADGATRIDGLDMRLDDTHLAGSIELPGLEPLAMRFTLAADHADLDRYTAPEDAPGEPLTLPLDALRALDVQGVLTIESATLAGAAARQVRIDVE